LGRNPTIYVVVIKIFRLGGNGQRRRRQARQKGRGMGGRNFCLLASSSIAMELETALEKGSCAKLSFMVKSPFPEPFN